MAAVNIDQDFMLRIESALDQIRPYLEADGGNVKVLEVTDEMVLKLELLGACGSCPMSTMTLKAGVEQSVLRAIPEIKSVEAVNVTPIA
ncbi:NifU family protein [uncultured Pontibacter sp.]|uniref:NifU family protein n=1 Tax=uncultured Pontibacter sp. TaxID=453356 RepID=UPI00260D2408|nr:NifU family protein [uncultured Pontibacter sp.]